WFSMQEPQWTTTCPFLTSLTPTARSLGTCLRNMRPSSSLGAKSTGSKRVAPLSRHCTVSPWTSWPLPPQVTHGAPRSYFGGLNLGTIMSPPSPHGGWPDSKTDEQLSPLFRPANERPLEWLN